MKWNEAIFTALTGVRDDLVEKSNAPAYPRSRRWRWAPVAACCALVLGTALALGTLRPLETENTAVTSVPAPVSETDSAPDPVPHPAVETWESPDYLAEFLAPQAVYFDYLSDDIIGPMAAVDDDGNVIAYTDCGTMWSVVDRSTGETLAVAVEERAENQTVPEADNRITLYSLQGEVIQEVEAFYLSCLGDLAVVSRTGGTDLYRRSDGSLVAEGLAGAYFVGDDLLYTETEYGGPVTVYDSTGTVVAENVELQINYNNHVWQGHGYLSVMDGKQRGLLDSRGQWVLEPRPWYIYAISHGYALCRDETSFYAVSLTDGEVAFESPYGICAAYSQGLLLELDAASFDYGWVMPGDDAHAQFVAWDGTVLAEGRRMQVIDDEYDGTAELLEISDGNFSRFYRPDGTLLREIDHSMGSISVISSETVLVMNNYEAEDGSWKMDVFLVELETGEEFRDFDRDYSYGSSLWLAADDSGSSFTTRLFYAAYQDEAGYYHTDLLDESGRVLLTDLVDQYSQQKGGVFAVNQGGLPTLVRLDGTVLYPVKEE